jgi:hypothetical protein
MVDQESDVYVNRKRFSLKRIFKLPQNGQRQSKVQGSPHSEVFPLLSDTFPPGFDEKLNTESLLDTSDGDERSNSQGAENKKSFTLTIDQLLELRRQFQIAEVPPDDIERVNQYITECHHALLGEYGLFIEKPITDKEMQQRIIITDLETFQRFTTEYTKQKEHLVYGDVSNALFRTYKDEGNFSIGHFINAYDILPLDEKQEVSQQYSTEESARDEYNQLHARNSILHEMMHIYESAGLPGYMSEVGAFYYTKRILEKRWGGIWSPSIDKTAAYFERVRDTFKEDVEKVFFQGLRGIESLAIGRRFYPEHVRDIFPDLSWQKV